MDTKYNRVIPARGLARLLGEGGRATEELGVLARLTVAESLHGAARTCDGYRSEQDLERARLRRN